MNLGQLASAFRFMMAEPGTNRFTASDVAQLATRAQYQVAFEIDFPQATQSINAVGGQQEYQLLEMMKLMRVYVLGPDGSKQELIGTDIYTLEGDIIQQYDNSSGTTYGNPVQSSQLFVQPGVQYPVTNIPISGRGGQPVPTKSPWGPNSRPQYYLRGGYIGLVPTPLASSPTTKIAMDFIPVPPALVLSSDLSLFPDIFLDALVWKMVMYARYSDNSSLVGQAEQAYRAEINDKIIPWLQRIQATKPKTLVPITKRVYFRRGRGNNV